MNVLMVHRHDFGEGGGNIAMARLHRGLREAGVRSRILCDRKVAGGHEESLSDRDGSEAVEIRRSRYARKVEPMLRNVLRPLGLNDLHAVSSFRIGRMDAYRDADVLDFHCLHGGFFNYLSLPDLTRDKGAVLTLHDMWPFTGHCHTSMDCGRWRSGCGDCPYLDVYPAVERDATATEWRLKDWTYRQCDVQVVASSRWMARNAERSMLGRFPVQVIPHGLDLETYSPGGGAERRKELGLAEDRKVLMAAGLDLSSRPKGGDLLVEAVHGLPERVRRQTTLVLMGRNAEDLQQRLPVETVCTGYLTDEDEKARTYAAADVFVHPSRAETFGLVVLESMACGTPTVAFSVGGIPEKVGEGGTGFLAEPEDAADLAEGMARLLVDDPLREHMSRICRERAEARYDIRDEVRGYIRVYRRALRQAA